MDIFVLIVFSISFGCESVPHKAQQVFLMSQFSSKPQLRCNRDMLFSG